MQTISLANSTQSIDIATKDEHGIIRAINSVDDPLVLRILEFLHGCDTKSLRVLINGKSHWIHEDAVMEAADAVRAANQIMERLK